MQLRLVIWTRFAVPADDELDELIDALRDSECDAALVQCVPRNWPGALAHALAAEYRQAPPQRQRHRLRRSLGGRRSAPGDAVAVLALQDRIIAAQTSPLPLLAVRLACGPWLVSARAGGGRASAERRLQRAAYAVLDEAGGAAVVLAVATASPPPRLDGLRHVAGHQGEHVFVSGPVKVMTGRATPAGGSRVLIADMRVGES